MTKVSPKITIKWNHVNFGIFPRFCNLSTLPKKILKDVLSPVFSTIINAAEKNGKPLSLEPELKDYENLFSSEKLFSLIHSSPSQISDQITLSKNYNSTTRILYVELEGWQLPIIADLVGDFIELFFQGIIPPEWCLRIRTGVVTANILVKHLKNIGELSLRSLVDTVLDCGLEIFKSDQNQLTPKGGTFALFSVGRIFWLFGNLVYQLITLVRSCWSSESMLAFLSEFNLNNAADVIDIAIWISEIMLILNTGGMGIAWKLFRRKKQIYRLIVNFLRLFFTTDGTFPTYLSLSLGHGAKRRKLATDEQEENSGLFKDISEWEIQSGLLWIPYELKEKSLSELEGLFGEEFQKQWLSKYSDFFKSYTLSKNSETIAILYETIWSHVPLRTSYSLEPLKENLYPYESFLRLYEEVFLVICRIWGFEDRLGQFYAKKLTKALKDQDQSAILGEINRTTLEKYLDLALKKQGPIEQALNTAYLVSFIAVHIRLEKWISLWEELWLSPKNITDNNSLTLTYASYCILISKVTLLSKDMSLAIVSELLNHSKNIVDLFEKALEVKSSY